MGTVLTIGFKSTFIPKATDCLIIVMLFVGACWWFSEFCLGSSLGLSMIYFPSMFFGGSFEANVGITSSSRAGSGGGWQHGLVGWGVSSFCRPCMTSACSWYVDLKYWIHFRICLLHSEQTLRPGIRWSQRRCCTSRKHSTHPRTFVLSTC